VAAAALVALVAASPDANIGGQERRWR